MDFPIKSTEHPHVTMTTVSAVLVRLFVRGCYYYYNFSIIFQVLSSSAFPFAQKVQVPTEDRLQPRGAFQRNSVAAPCFYALWRLRFC